MSNVHLACQARSEATELGKPVACGPRCSESETGVPHGTVTHAFHVKGSAPTQLHGQELVLQVWSWTLPERAGLPVGAFIPLLPS